MSTTTTTTTTTTTAEAQRELEDRGIASHVAQRLSRSSTPDLIGAWSAYAKRNPRMGPGALVNAIRHGAPPPGTRPKQPSQGPDLEPVRRWLRSHLPELADDRGDPHPAAVLAAWRIRFRCGRLNVDEHAQALRGAVADAEAEAAER